MRLRIIAIFFLLGTLINGLPYFYFQILRFIVCGTSIYGYALIKENQPWKIMFIIIGILFNPLIPFHLPRNLWKILDLMTVLIFYFSLLKIKTNSLKITTINIKF